jgi:hypothetical protein
MENEPSNMQQALPPEQAAAKVAILSECDRLTEAGISHCAHCGLALPFGISKG